MADSVNEVGFDRAVQILEISAGELEQLLDTGVLRGYRRGNDIVFLREDLASFITSSSAAAPQERTPLSGRRRGSMDDLKKAAMGQPDAGAGMFSAKQYAVEHGMIPPSAPPPEPSPVAGMPTGREPSPPAGPSPVAGMPTGGGPSPPPGPSPVAKMGAREQAPPPGAPAGDAALAAENESLRGRLQAAEEVLNDLQSRCERMNELESESQTHANQVKMLQTALVEAEAKVGVYEEMDSEGGGSGVGPLGFGAPDAEEKVIALKRETADMRGELAGVKRRFEDAEKEVNRYKSERDELESKLRAAKTEGTGGESARAVELEKELGTLNADFEELTAERDMLAIEAEVARELKGEIERASELEDNLNTQREVIEAAQERLEQLESERDELEKKARDLEERASAAESGGAKAAELSERLKTAEGELTAEREKVAQVEARTTALRAERDGLTEELENRDDEMARLRAEVQKRDAAVEEVEKLKAGLQKAKESEEAAQLGMHKAQADLSLREQLIQQYRAEERTSSDLEADNARMREEVALAEGKGKQADARMAGLRAERDGLTAELAKVQGAMDELRGQAERASDLLAESRALKHDLEAARERTAELESTVEMNRAERDRLAAELQEATSRAEGLERKLRSQERDLGSIAQKVEAAPVDDRLRRELEALRGDIAKQMSELGQIRAQGEAATRRRSRSRSAEEIARKSRRAPSVRPVDPARRPVGPPRRPVAAPQAKPKTLGRFQIGEEIGRSRSGALYRSSLPPSDKPVDVLALPDELTRDRRFLERFWREMRIVSELDHENLLGVIDIGESGGVHYVAYEHLEGESLADLLKKEETLPPERALAITSGVVAGLTAAAKNEIVHGDLKPSNVMVSSDGRVKLAGLGLARGSDDDASGLNERGRIEHYAAPEQILAQGRDARSDVYSAGALLFKMLTGKAPLEVGSLSEARGLVQLNELPRPEELTELSPGLRGVLSKTLAEKPDDRYQSLANLATALKRVKP